MNTAMTRLEARGRRLAEIYVAASVVLVAFAAFRSSSVSEWLIRGGFAFLMLVVSLRYALVWLYRRKKSKLPWLVAPSPTEHEFEVMWFVYACVLAAAAVLIALI